MKNELFSPLFPLGLKLIELHIWVVNTLPLTWGQEIKPTENLQQEVEIPDGNIVGALGSSQAYSLH